MIKKCVECKKEFECYDKPNKRHKRFKRRYGSVTCSPKCSKEYKKIIIGRQNE